MIPRTALFAFAAAFTVAAAAQADDGYDPGRSCRTYVMQKLPVPVHCMAELVGNWSAKPYLDGEFMFRNRDEFLQWRDREDYRHWKAHDYAWHAGMAAVPVSAPPPAPVAQPLAPPAGQPAAALLCPAEIPARIAVDRSVLQGWTGGDAAVMLRIDPPPRAEGGQLICTYGPGRVILSRPAWGRCVVRSDGLGFDCTP